MKNQKKNSWMPADEQGCKKRFLTRIIEEKEAEFEIKRFCGTGEATSGEMSYAQDVDAEGSVRNLSP